MNLTPDDYAQAQRLAARYRGNRLAAYIIVPIAVVLLTWYLLSSPHHHPISHLPIESVGNMLRQIVSLVIMAALFIVFLLGLLVRSKLWVTQQEPGDVTVDEEGLHLHAATEDLHIRWNRYTCALEDTHLFLLLNNLQAAATETYILPKRFITDEADQARLRAMIVKHVGPINARPGRAPVEPPAQG